MNTRTPFTPAGNVIPLFPDRFTVATFSLNSVKENLDGLHQIVSDYGFETMFSTIAEQVIQLRVRIAENALELPVSLEQQLAKYEGEIIAYNAKVNAQ